MNKLNKCLAKHTLKVFVQVLNIGNLIRTPIEYTQACSSGMTFEDSVFCSWTKDSSNLGLAISSSVVEIILEALMIYGSEKVIISTIV